MADRDAKEINRIHWEDRAEIHARDSTGFYRIAEFRAGADTLTPIETAELGNVSALRVLHLQCHLGLDTLSLARRGATVTGLDFSAKAIGFARQLSAETELRATFVEGDVHDVRDLIAGTFDRVFATWGIFCWIPDVTSWICCAASMLHPGGRLYIADDHPTAAQLEEQPGPDGRPRLVVTEPWRTTSNAPVEYHAAQSYTGDAAQIDHTANHQWPHELSAFINGIVDGGLSLSFLHEHDRVPWRRFPSMERAEAGLWRLPANAPGVPLAFSLLASRRP
jgi:SAM-dependent methyltransferase